MTAYDLACLVSLDCDNDFVKSAGYGQEAVNLLVPTLRMDDSDAEALQRIATVLSHWAIAERRAGKLEESEVRFNQAIGALRDLVVKRPKLADFKNTLAHALKQYGELLVERMDEKAEATLLEARDLWSELAKLDAPSDACFQLSTFYLLCERKALRDLVAADEQIQVAIQNLPNEPKYQSRAALVSALRGQSERAQAYLDKAESLRGEYCDTDYLAQAVLAGKAGRVPEKQAALEEFEKWTQAHRPYSYEAKLLRGLVE